MDLITARLVPAPGSDGIVARSDGAVLFVATRTPVADVARLVDEVLSRRDATPARSLARQMAAIVGSDDDTTLPPFALVAASADGIYVKAYGAVEVRLQGDGVDEVLSGVGSFTGVDRELTGPFHTVLAHRAGDAAPAPAFDIDVRAGAAAGAGFALTTRREPTDAPSADLSPIDAPPVADPPSADPPSNAPPVADPPSADPAEPASGAEGLPALHESPDAPTSDERSASFDPITEDEAPPAETSAEPATLPPTPVDADVAAAGGFTSQLLGALDPEEPELRPALPVDLDPAEVRAPDQISDEVVTVHGVICSRRHFNDPRSRFCSSCGISMVQNTQVLTRGPRPPLGVMVFEDGATFSLSTDYVVGRQPEVSELVQQGLALPLPVDDPERSISRAHAELRLVEWDVHLVNLSDTNGSFVWDETQQQWVPIPAGQSVVLTPGLRVALGRRSAVFESSLVR